MILYLLGFASCAQYAILYAGSLEFFNYRHQADIFTIYNQLLSRGFTANNIALYAYDDIATDPENVYPGQLFHSIDHKVNVYPGSSAINVRGDDVTADAFYKAISNLPTTSEDYVFIYYDNHGFQGVLGTPDYKFIYGDQLGQVFLSASQKNLYKKSLFLIEACYSASVASVVVKSAPDLAIITAANAKESSYAAVYDTEMGVYLSNEFTNYFIEIIDQYPEMSVANLFEKLQNHTEQSHVCFFGDESIQNLPLSTFIGIPKNNIIINNRKSSLQLVTQKEATERTISFFSEHPKPALRARYRMKKLQNLYCSQKLKIVLEMIVQYVDENNFEKIMNTTETELTDTYFKVLRIFTERYGFINPDDFALLNVLNTLSVNHTKAEIVQAIFAIVP